MAIITGTAGDDKYPNGIELRGTNGDDQIYGLAGSDSLVGFDGDDLLEGGAGADELWGGYGFDYASYQSSPARVLINLFHADSASGGDAAGDRLYEIDGVVGSAFADGLSGNDGENVLRGGGGDDVLNGFGGNDTVQGEAGNDRLNGQDGVDRLDGGEGNDVLEGGVGDDMIEGGAGNDTASFIISHNAGVAVDLASGTARGDAVGSDRLAGVENVEGSFNDDRLAGDGGANVLQGRWGADMLEGRSGADRFVYGQDYDSRPAAPDRILDFSPKQGDRIDLAAVDANAQVTGDQAFQFIGQDAFTAAGQVRFFKAAGDTVVEVNTDDTAPGAEMRIEIDPIVNFQGTDFVL